MSPIPVRSLATTPSGWKTELAGAVDSVEELLVLLGLANAPALEYLKEPRFGLRVPHAYIRKMRRNDPDDPLLRQVLPLAAESAEVGFIDPVSDLAAMAAPGVLHKYDGRALLVTTGACAVNCRYCFRRHFPYSKANPLGNHLDGALAYIKRQQDIREVILSGGDPLVLSNSRLAELIEALGNLPRLRWLRIHTRLPVVLPSRIDSGLLEILTRTPLRTTVVIHANHPNEIAREETLALERLAGTGLNLLNQSVLLKGVNDSAKTLIALSERLYESHVLPYYLHMLDPVRGAMHFDVPVDAALDVIEEMRVSLPGFLVPRLVREEPGQPAKTAISGN